MAGHMGAGESPEISAFREVKEEIGVTLDTTRLEKIGIFQIEKRHSERIWDREFTHTFLYQLDEKTRLVPQVSEVEALEWVRIENFEQMVILKDVRFVPNSTERYQKVLQEIKSRLQRLDK